MTGPWTQLPFVLADVLAAGDGRLDPTPEANDVTAGWAGSAIFIGLIVAVVVIAFFLSRQLRRAQAAKDAGVFGDEPTATGSGAEPDADQEPDQRD